MHRSPRLNHLTSFPPETSTSLGVIITMIKLFKKKQKCKVLGCNNRVHDGDIGDLSLPYGYCKIHKLEGLVKEVEE